MQKQVEKKKYYVVRERAVPEVLLKVVEAKRLLESKRVATVQEAAERTGISRSSFYKYKDDIFPFYDNTKGKINSVKQEYDETKRKYYLKQIEYVDRKLAGLYQYIENNHPYKRTI